MKFQIIGHTDNFGDDSFNTSLGLKRAKSVQSFFVNHGISQRRLSIKSKGESSPIAPNSHENGKDNPFGRKLNRRVEFVVVVF